MYVLTIDSIVYQYDATSTLSSKLVSRVYQYDNEKDARKAFHQSVVKNGINNVKVTYV